MQFAYSAATADGKMTRGVVAAANQRAAIALLERQQLVVVKLERRRDGKAQALYRVPLLQRMLLAQHLSTLLRAGVSLLEGLRVVQEEARSRRLRKLLERVRVKVSSGTTFAAALESQGGAFDSLFTSLVRVGESSGTLEENLSYLADELEKRMALHTKVRSALTYPAVVVGVTGVLGAVLAFFVLPKIVPLFTSLKVKLPLSTEILLRVAGFSRDHGMLSLALIAGAIIAFRLLTLRGPLRRQWHWFLLRLPVVGRITRSLNLANACRTLGTLLKSGVPLLEALDITAGTLGNTAYREEFSALRDAAGTGTSLAASMAQPSRRKLFPPLTLSLVRVGESSGKLDESLLYLNRFYEREVDNLMKDLTVILEPMLLVFIGLVVAFVAGAIITPIYQISGSLRVR
ncbi:MAG: type IV pilus assembly protein PilC [Parcubacteria group bacterium Gr01-1014_31]|nr:MAG: type IV pilus assembly protein PilC [Parcubacteria group bacterium Gr01-1014_31]